MSAKFRFILLISLFPIVVKSQTNPMNLDFEKGHIKVHLHCHGGEKAFILETTMPSTTGGLNTQLVSADSSGIRTRQSIRYFDHTCEISNTVEKTSYGLRWDITIQGEGSDWTGPIETIMQWEDSRSMNFWTTWSDNHLKAPSDAWEDPFLPAPFKDLALVYGGDTHLSRDAFVIPIASSFFRDEDLGVSFVQALDDTLLDLEMHTTPEGQIAYRHLHHRIGKGHIVHITHQIVLHESDWRAGISWVMQQYKDYFFPKEPLVNQLAGSGAYSSYEGKLDTAKYRKMGFSLNWKASLDFPYMGLFIPPVKNDNERWVKYRQAGVRIGDGYASINRLNSYSERLDRLGFHTISYFNVNEFGNKIVYPYSGHKVREDTLWKNANDFVYRRLQHAFLKPAGQLPSWDERPLFSNWEDCIVLDPGDSAYQAFLLEQARMHIVKIPFSSGICIDRMDWLRFYNSNADDGVSMVQQQKTRSLLLSWKDILDKIGSEMHTAHKVIFCNPLDRRIDLMAQVDGIYDEFGYLTSSLNLCAQLAFGKPIIAWTAVKENLLPDPDAYFQHHLYLGAFLTVPFPGNDHCIQPDEWAEKYYTDYGMLMEAIKGREWVLSSHIVRVEDGTAKATVFKVKGKIVVPVVLGGVCSQAVIVLRLPYSLLGKEDLLIRVLYPGESNWQDFGGEIYNREMRLVVPLKRGCALVSIE